jgi:hypothetical protein
MRIMLCSVSRAMQFMPISPSPPRGVRVTYDSDIMELRGVECEVSWKLREEPPKDKTPKKGPREAALRERPETFRC